MAATVSTDGKHSNTETLKENNINHILLRRKDAFLVPEQGLSEPTEHTKELVATLGANIGTMGYALSKELAERLSEMPADELVKLGKDMEEGLKELLGADVEYKPMYPNFPNSVVQRSDMQLFFDAVVYAVTDFTVLPFDPPAEIAAKEEAAKMSKMKMISLADGEMPKEIMRNLMASPVAFSPEDKKDMEEIGEYLKDITPAIPDKIPNRENLAWLAAGYMEKGKKENNPFLDKFTSAKDILRLMVVRGGGDASMSEGKKLKRVSRSEAKAYAEKIASMPHAERDLYSQRNLFKYVANINHFRNFKEPKIQEMLDRMYGNTMERSFSSERDSLIRDKDFGGLVASYSSAPGQMGADAVRLVRLAAEQDDYNLAKATLCTAFKENAKKMSATNLLKVDKVLEANEEPRDFSIYSPKKGLANPYMKPETKEPLRKDLADLLREAAKAELRDRYKEKRPLGKVYIEEGLKDIKLPMQQRTNSKNSTGMAYGSQFPLHKDANRLRAFIWWTNSKETNHTDIDLSCTIYDKNLKSLYDIAYYNMVGRYGSQHAFGVHSGDMRDGGPEGGPGVAEFLDIDLKGMKEAIPEAAYVMYTVNLYSGRSFADTPCKFGWMQDDKEVYSGEIQCYEAHPELYDVSEAERSIVLNSESTRSIPVMFDIENQKMIWMDRNPRAFSNFEVRYPETYAGVNNNVCNASPMMVEARKALNGIIPDLYTLAEQHALSRGEITDDPKEADTVFTVERASREDYPNATEFLCAYDQDLILGDYMSDQLSEKDKKYFDELREAEKTAAEEEIVW